MTSDYGGYPPPGGQPWDGSRFPPPGYPGQPQTPPTRGKRKWPWIVGIVAAVVVVVLAVAVTLLVGSKTSDPDAAVQRTVVSYSVTGAAETVELSYEGADGQVALKTVDLPWRETVTLEGQDAFFEVSARTTDGSDQELACRVITYGTTLLEDRTVGGFVSCNGRLNEK